jgi:hypothetical protein
MSLAAAPIGLAGAAHVALPAGTLNSAGRRHRPRAPGAAVRLRETPVTRNAEFRRFGQAHRRWPAGAPVAVAGRGYLQA